MHKQQLLQYLKTCSLTHQISVSSFGINIEVTPYTDHQLLANTAIYRHMSIYSLTPFPEDSQRTQVTSILLHKQFFCTFSYCPNSHRPYSLINTFKNLYRTRDGFSERDSTAVAGLFHASCFGLLILRKIKIIQSSSPILPVFSEYLYISRIANTMPVYKNDRYISLWPFLRHY
jgi:hypothetical protein